MRNIGFVCCMAAAFCLLPPSLGWFDSGQWRWPGFDIRHVFGLSEAILAPLPLPHGAAESLLSANPGLVFFALGMIFMAIARRRTE